MGAIDYVGETFPEGSRITMLPDGRRRVDVTTGGCSDEAGAEVGWGYSLFPDGEPEPVRPLSLRQRINKAVNRIREDFDWK